MKYYQDQQDTKRYLSPIEEVKNKSICKVFFDASKDGDRTKMEYAGKTTIATNLLIDAFTGSWKDNTAFVAV